MAGTGDYLKKHTEALVKDVGIEAACALAGKSKATLGRYYSGSAEHADRFMPIDTVAAIEAAARYPHVTSALAEITGHTIAAGPEGRQRAAGRGQHRRDRAQPAVRDADGGIPAVDRDGIITVNEAKRLLRETLALQQVLVDMKLHLEEETGVDQSD